MKLLLSLAIASVACSNTVCGQWAMATILEKDTVYVEESSTPRALWRRVSVGHTTAPRYYKDMRAAIFVAQYDPSWRSPTLPGLGVLTVNPGRLVFADLNANVKYSYRRNGEDRWMVWTKLPSVPAAVIGAAFSYQFLVWEKNGPPNYSLVTGGNIPGLTVVPR